MYIYLYICIYSTPLSLCIYIYICHTRNKHRTTYPQLIKTAWCWNAKHIHGMKNKHLKHDNTHTQTKHTNICQENIKHDKPNIVILQKTYKNKRYHKQLPKTQLDMTKHIQTIQTIHIKQSQKKHIQHHTTHIELTKKTYETDTIKNNI